MSLVDESQGCDASNGDSAQGIQMLNPVAPDMDTEKLHRIVSAADYGESTPVGAADKVRESGETDSDVGSGAEKRYNMDELCAESGDERLAHNPLSESLSASVASEGGNSVAKMTCEKIVEAVEQEMSQVPLNDEFESQMLNHPIAGCAVTPGFGCSVRPVTNSDDNCGVSAPADTVATAPCANKCESTPLAAHSSAPADSCASTPAEPRLLPPDTSPSAPAAAAIATGKHGATPEKKKKKVKKSVFESQPASSTADSGAFMASRSCPTKTVFESQAATCSTAHIKATDRVPDRCTGKCVFESTPAPKAADFTSHDSIPAVPGTTKSVFESQPTCMSKVDFKHGVPAATKQTPTVFESQPSNSKATVRSADGTPIRGRSGIFESNPKPSTAFARHDLSVPSSIRSAAEAVIYESKPKTSTASASWKTSKEPALSSPVIFENNPKPAAVDASALRPISSESEYETDDGNDAS